MKPKRIGVQLAHRDVLRTKATGRTVRLTDQMLVGLARSGSVRKAVPAFKTLFDSLSNAGCRTCNNAKIKAQKRQGQVLLGLKQSIANLEGEKLRQFKKMVSADTLIVYVRTAKGSKKRVI